MSGVSGSLPPRICVYRLAAPHQTGASCAAPDYARRLDGPTRPSHNLRPPRHRVSGDAGRDGRRRDGRARRRRVRGGRPRHRRRGIDGAGGDRGRSRRSARSRASRSASTSCCPRTSAARRRRARGGERATMPDNLLELLPAALPGLRQEGEPSSTCRRSWKERDASRAAHDGQLHEGAGRRDPRPQGARLRVRPRQSRRRTSRRFTRTARR